MADHVIPFVDLSDNIRSIEPQLLEALTAVVRDGGFSGGKFVDKFEKEYAANLHLSHFAGVSNGSDALFLALRALGIGPGDEVIVPGNTFIATPFAAARLGAVPVFADCDPVTWEIDPASVEKCITPQTKAIIGVHLYGQAFPLDEINAIAKAHNLLVLEDCAQSQQTLYKGSFVGGLSDAGCFSFYPTKNLGACGEAGGVACRSEEADQTVRYLRNQGMEEKYHHEMLGYNMRMDGFQAAVLSVKLPHLAAWNARRAQIVEKYHREITNPALTFQGVLPYTQPAWYLAVACVADRDHFMRYMDDCGIHCGIHYPIPCHLQKAMAHLGYKEGDLPHVEYECGHCVSLPLYPELPESDVDKVIEACMGYRAK